MVIISNTPLSITTAYMPVVFTFYKDSLDTVKTFVVEVYDVNSLMIHKVYARVTEQVANRYFGQIDLSDIIKNYIAPNDTFNKSHGTGTSNLYENDFGTFRFFIKVDSLFLNPVNGLTTAHNIYGTSTFFTVAPFTQSKKQQYQASYLYSNLYSAQKEALTIGKRFVITKEQPYWLTVFCDDDSINAVKINVIGKTQNTTGFHYITSINQKLLSVNVGTQTLPALDDVGGFFPTVNINDILYYFVEFGVFTTTSGPGGFTFVPKTITYRFEYSDCNPFDKTLISFFNTAGGCNIVAFTKAIEVKNASKGVFAAKPNKWNAATPDSHDPISRENFKLASTQREVYEMEYLLEDFERYLDDLISSVDTYIIVDNEFYRPIVILDTEYVPYNNEELYERLVVRFEYSHTKVIANF